ncbi:MAG: response regulator [Caldilineaceae bacterium]
MTSEVHNDSNEIVGGSETILLVEDDDMVRNLAQAALRWYGYNIVATENGDQAIAICQHTTDRIHLLLTDIVMPGMNGTQVADTLTSLKPDVAVLFMSGYTASIIVHHGVLNDRTELIEKPFSPDQLARKVRSVLDKQKNQGLQGDR